MAAVGSYLAPPPGRGRGAGWRALRRQLPVHSPLTPRALLAGAAALRGRGDPEGELEGELRRRYGAREARLCASGTDALARAIGAALAARGGRVVALPAYACYDVATAAIAAGAAVRLYDVDPRTLAPDLDSFRGAVAAAAAAVVAPLYGVPVAWEPLRREAEAAGALLIEDAAQGHGASWGGRPLGSLGDLAVLSFGRGKGWTGGRGGALLAHADLLPPPAPLAPTEEVGALARAALQWVLGRPAVYALPAALPWLRLGETVYHPPAPPAPMGRAAAAVALAAEAVALHDAAHRRALGEVYRALLAGARAARSVSAPAEGRAGHLRYPVLTHGAAQRVAEDRELRALGVAPGYPLPLSRLSVLLPHLQEPGHYPGAESLACGLVTLPTHGRVSAAEATRIAWAVERRLPAPSPAPLPVPARSATPVVDR